jgi:hypothetical protein
VYVYSKEVEKMSRIISQFSGKLNTLALSQSKKQKNRQQKLFNHFSKNKDLRLELVEQTYHRPMPAAEPLTPDEMAAVYALLSCTYPMGQVLQIVERFSCDGWAAQFGEEFFTALETCCRDLKRSGFTKVSRDLTKIGEVSARMHSNSLWADRFGKKIDSSLSHGIRDQPFLKQPGW